MSILVTGGAGYIGSHVVSQLLQQGENVVVIDDLSTGLLSRLGAINPLQIDLSKQEAVEKIRKVINENSVKSVIHLAAKKSVPESLANPMLYFSENVGGLLHLLSAIQSTNVSKFVFSSSAAVYGAVNGRINETNSTNPINPYGTSKLMGEQILNSISECGDLRIVNLRYFNVAGTGSNSLADNSASNLIPMVFERISKGASPQIFGTDYPTEDGTCIRDFIHVVDLASAHISSLNYLDKTSEKQSTFNVGTGTGYSVKEVIEVIRKVSSYSGEIEFLPRRKGDPAQVIADVELVNRELSWKSRYGINEMVQSAWEATKL